MVIGHRELAVLVSGFTNLYTIIYLNLIQILRFGSRDCNSS